MYFVYVLHSLTRTDRYYVGYTTNLRQRLICFHKDITIKVVLNKRDGKNPGLRSPSQLPDRLREIQFPAKALKGKDSHPAAGMRKIP